MSELAKIDLPWVQAFSDRHGRQRYYFRRRGYPRVALPDDPGSPEFSAAYTAAQRASERMAGMMLCSIAAFAAWVMAGARVSVCSSR